MFHRLCKPWACSCLCGFGSVLSASGIHFDKCHNCSRRQAFDQSPVHCFSKVFVPRFVSAPDSISAFLCLSGCTSEAPWSCLPSQRSCRREPLENLWNRKKGEETQWLDTMVFCALQLQCCWCFLFLPPELHSWLAVAAVFIHTKTHGRQTNKDAREEYKGNSAFSGKYERQHKFM